MCLSPAARAFDSLKNVELQPLRAQVLRVTEALDYLGNPISDADRLELQRAMQLPQEADAIAGIQRVLDRYVLVEVTINPESRVSVSQSSAAPMLVQGGWSVFLVKVVNQSGLTGSLRAECPQALPDSGHAPGSQITATGIVPPGASRPVQTITRTDVTDRWLDLDLYAKPPLAAALSGLGVEYRILELYSRDRGIREARLAFNAGPLTKDIGFRNDVSIVFRCQTAHTVRLRIRDFDGSPATASLLITDAQGRVYPAQAKRLAPDFPFQRQIYRTDGDSIDLPVGNYTAEFTRGPEYFIKRMPLQVGGGDGAVAEFHLDRWVNPSEFGWYSGDHHIHAAGCAHYNTPSEGVLPQDIVRQVRGEGLNVGEVLTWGPSWYYQKQFFTGRVDRLSNDRTLLRYDVEVSGFPSSYWGHLVLLQLNQQDYPGADRLEEWPTWNLPILKWAKSQGAVTGYAHTGHGLGVATQELPNYLIPPFNDNGANEFLVDLAHGAVDFLSAVDTPPAAELNLWYHSLNCGFRVPVSGETDFPCLFERVGIGRSYIHLPVRPGGDEGYRAWIRGLKKGQSYVSDGRGHVFDMRVEDAELASTGELRLAAPGIVRVSAKVAAFLEEHPSERTGAIRRSGPEAPPYWHIERARKANSRTVAVELIVNGRAADSADIVADGSLRPVQFTTRIDGSSWVALRILASCHSNPIYITVSGKTIRASRLSAQWCLDSIDAAWKHLGPRVAPNEQKDARAAYEHAAGVYRSIAAESTAE